MVFTLPPQVMQTAFILIAIVIGVVIILMIGGITYLIMYNRQFSKTKVVIYREHKNQDGSTVPIIVDLKESGGIIKDRKLKKFVFHLKKKNVHMGDNDSQGQEVINQETRELQIPSIPCEGGKDIVFVQQLGTKKYAFAKPFLVDSSQMKLFVSSADMAEAIRGYDMNARAFEKKENPILMIAIVAIVAVVIMIMIIYTMSKFELIVTASQNLKEATSQMAVAKGASVASGAPT